MRLVLLLSLIFAGVSAHAQQAPTRTAEVVSIGRHVVEIPATTVSLLLWVRTNGATPARAGELNATASARLRAALRNLGIPGDSLLTRDFRAEISVDYETKDTSFVTNNAFLVRTRNLALLPRIIESALASGATDVTELDFSADDIEAAYLEALRVATTMARQRAATMADAAGGRLGNILGMSAQEPTQGTNNYVQANLAMVTTTRSQPGRIEIEAPVIRVGAVVSMRFEIIPRP